MLSLNKAGYETFISGGVRLDPLDGQVDKMQQMNRKLCMNYISTILLTADQRIY